MKRPFATLILGHDQHEKEIIMTIGELKAMFNKFDDTTEVNFIVNGKEDVFDCELDFSNVLDGEPLVMIEIQDVYGFIAEITGNVI